MDRKVKAIINDIRRLTIPEFLEFSEYMDLLDSQMAELIRKVAAPSQIFNGVLIPADAAPGERIPMYKIRAIKCIREWLGCSLKDAKEISELTLPLDLSGMCETDQKNFQRDLQNIGWDIR